MTRIVAVHGALPPHRHTQPEITDMVARTCLPPGADRRVLDRLHANARVRTRHTVLPLDGYRDLDGFGPANRRCSSGPPSTWAHGLYAAPCRRPACAPPTWTC
ncbi:hypothetical protein SCALM49S_04888 [Streptomyces californicus]